MILFHNFVRSLSFHNIRVLWVTVPFFNFMKMLDQTA